MNPYDAFTLSMACLGVAIALVVGAAGFVLGRRASRRGDEAPDVIRVTRCGDTFVVTGVYGNDSHTIRELIRLYCIRRGLPPADLGAGGIPLRRVEYGAAVWPFRFQGSEVRG